MLRSDFDYDLPPELIAQTARERGKSRMLVADPRTDQIRHGRFPELPSLLASGDVLVINDTRVFPARLTAEPKGQMTRPIEVLLTKRTGLMQWECWCKPGRRLRRGDTVRFNDRLGAEVLERRGDGTFVLAFRLDATDPGEDSESVFWEEIERIGEAPLPPYIHSKESVARIREDYQTVYARNRGAVAAPTAGLHFTDEILEEIEGRGVTIVRVTLHVGTGTFRPVTVERVEDHRMDFEEYEIGVDQATTLDEALRSNRRIVAVGTTSVRTLEAAIREGDGTIRAGRGRTDLFITPGFEFRVVDALLTNFHLPESTLLMLVSAFAGKDFVHRAYHEAIRERYMFYSFGDCMFLRSGR